MTHTARDLPEAKVSRHTCGTWTWDDEPCTTCHPEARRDTTPTDEVPC